MFLLSYPAPLPDVKWHMDYMYPTYITTYMLILIKKKEKCIHNINDQNFKKRQFNTVQLHIAHYILFCTVVHTRSVPSVIPLLARRAKKTVWSHRQQKSKGKDATCNVKILVLGQWARFMFVHQLLCVCVASCMHSHPSSQPEVITSTPLRCRSTFSRSCAHACAHTPTHTQGYSGSPTRKHQSL